MCVNKIILYLDGRRFYEYTLMISSDHGSYSQLDIVSSEILLVFPYVITGVRLGAAKSTYNRE